MMLSIVLLLLSLPFTFSVSSPALPGLYAIKSTLVNITIFSISPISGNTTKIVNGTQSIILPDQLVTVDSITTYVWGAVASSNY